MINTDKVPVRKEFTIHLRKRYQLSKHDKQIITLKYGKSYEEKQLGKAKKELQGSLRLGGQGGISELSDIKWDIKNEYYLAKRLTITNLSKGKKHMR